MMSGKQHKKLSLSSEIAYAAVMCALLIGGQYLFSYVSGVEIVTVLLLCFSAVFGARCGILSAVAFSLLRCLVFGFYPSVIVLYLIYFPLFAAVFGWLGHIPNSVYKQFPLWFALLLNFLLLGIATACMLAVRFDLIKISRLYKTTITVFLWVIAGLSILLCLLFNVLLAMKKFGKDTSDVLKTIVFASIAAVCTIGFSLLDDVITPLFYGYDGKAALAYFYTSFTAMLPQTVCTIVTVCTLFLPVTAILEKVRLFKKTK